MRRVFRFGGGAAIRQHVDDELAFHIEMRTRDLIARGYDADAARSEALRQFGDMAGVRDSCITYDTARERSMQRANFLDDVTQDLRYAVRTLRRSPAFTTVVILTLALGIGANTSIFTLVEAVILRSIPVRNPSELVALGNTARIGGMSFGSYHTDLYSYPLYKDVRDRNQLVSELAATARTPRLDVRLNGEEPSHPRGRFVTGNYFRMLGVGAQIGRTFDGSEDAAIGAAPFVVISDAYWSAAFERSRDVVGRKLSINGVPFSIVGVAAPGYAGEVVGVNYDLWIPLTMQHAIQPSQRFLEQRSSNFLLLLGRLKPGVTLDQARAGFEALVRQILVENANADNPAGVLQRMDVPVSEGARGFSRLRQEYRVALYTLMAGVGLLLLIICANVSNLLLARAVARGREMGIRLAVGAARARIVRQLLTEAGVLALLSAGAGFALAVWGTRLLIALAADGGTSMALDLGLNWTVLGFTAGVAILAVGIFGLAPALRASNINLAATMGTQGRVVVTSGMRRGGSLGSGRLLIVSQVAISLVLLVGAGLLVRNLMSVQRTDTGIDRDHLVIASVDAIDRGYRDDRLRQLPEIFAARFRRIPGVTAVTYSMNGIFSGIDNEGLIQAPGFSARTREDSSASYDIIAPGYVRAIGARLLEGREFDDSDRPGAPRTALVNATMAKTFFPGGSAVGRTFRMDSVSYTVVGVVADVPYHSLTQAPDRRVYLSWAQVAAHVPMQSQFEIRTSGDPAAVVASVRSAMKAVDPAFTTWVDPLSSLMRNSIGQERLVARLALGFGVLALLLAAIGLYGVLTYAVTRRTNEIGLRVALGAQQRDVIGMVIGDALKLVGVGILIGAPLAMVAVRLMRDQLDRVEPTDPVAIGVALLVMAGAGFAAALLPARRASKLDPLAALRAD